MSDNQYPYEIIRGLKDNEISELVSAVTKLVSKTVPDPPQCLRELVKHAVLNYLRANDLAIDPLKILSYEPDEPDEMDSLIQSLRASLETIACLGNGNTHGNSIGNCMAIDALNKIEYYRKGAKK